ncbi:DUF1292 domain-containing protein [Baia soyae]|uniref:Uncharacterized protein DUF1292 n=1 Tax=Baia soyae TaxID=1544746 RepID=A0A4R2RIV9_9BACL|nr:DUF1292 domain-containing protein [Baia soyae]TCP62077.1 uncharacterized protein DUF1292 [Baia soyae]
MFQSFHGEKYGYPFQRSEMEVEHYRRLHQFEHEDQTYYILHRQHDPTDDVYLFRLDQDQLTEIHDLTEWENVANYIDDQYFQKLL